MDTRRNTTNEARRQTERESARLFGRHVSREKGIALLAVTLLVCALPMLLGVRLWDSIPEWIQTGLTRADGGDDSLPRAAAVFALPGLMCLLNLLTHVQLLVNQRRMTLPKAHIRLMGRWGFPILSVFFCGGVILRSAGREISPGLLALCALGLALLLLGSHLWDCPREALLSLRPFFPEGRADSWRPVHRLAGMLLLAAGVLTVTAAFLGAVSGHVSN